MTVSVQEDLAAAAAHHRAGRLNQAAAFYQRVLEAEPANSAALQLLGLVELSQGLTTQATARLQQAVLLQPNAAAAHQSLAEAFRAADRLAAARRHYEIAVSLDPGVALAWHALGQTLAQLGHTQAAIAALRQAVAVDPRMVGAYWELAQAGQQDIVPRLQSLLGEPGLAESDRINLHYALAHLLDQADRYDEAFAHLETVNATLRAQSDRFSADALRSYVDSRVAGGSPSLFGRLQGCGSETDLPVFVVGMPRSGTTLVEQMLASHSQVRGVGESHSIALLAQELQRSSIAPDYGAWHPAVCRQVAEGHAHRLRVLARGARRVVDKTPDNLFHLAAIGVLFPAARIVICRRDPRDTCLSCYFQHFTYPAPYANDLAACAIRHREVDRMIGHWRTALPLRLYEVQYERLVADPEAEGRRLVEHLGLEWEPGCLDFHRTRRPVRSASLWQVRRPLYTRSVGRWRHYARHIGPLLDAFGRD